MGDLPSLWEMPCRSAVTATPAYALCLVVVEWGAWGWWAVYWHACSLPLAWDRGKTEKGLKFIKLSAGAAPALLQSLRASHRAVTLLSLGHCAQDNSGGEGSQEDSCPTSCSKKCHGLHTGLEEDCALQSPGGQCQKYCSRAGHCQQVPQTRNHNHVEKIQCFCHNVLENSLRREKNIFLLCSISGIEVGKQITQFLALCSFSHKQRA